MQLNRSFITLCEKVVNTEIHECETEIMFFVDNDLETPKHLYDYMYQLLNIFNILADISEKEIRNSRDEELKECGWDVAFKLKELMQDRVNQTQHEIDITEKTEIITHQKLNNDLYNYQTGVDSLTKRLKKYENNKYEFPFLSIFVPQQGLFLQPEGINLDPFKMLDEDNDYSTTLTTDAGTYAVTNNNVITFTPHSGMDGNINTVQYTVKDDKQKDNTEMHKWRKKKSGKASNKGVLSQKSPYCD